jgi:hypothetical protein
MPAASVAEYLAELPEEKRAVVRAVRDVVNQHLPAGYEEGLQYGMIGWYVPRSRYPAGYHANPKQPLPYLSLAAQRSHYALYLMGLYGTPGLVEWFVAEHETTGKKLDMGKSCLRFKRLDDLPLALVGEAVARLPVEAWIAAYAASLATRKPAAKRPAAREPAPKKPAARTPAARKPAAKEPAAGTPAARKPAAKKPAAREAAAKKPVAKQPVAKRR